MRRAEVMVKARQFYEGYMPNSSIQWIANISAEHAWITDFYGNACDYLGPDFINNCNYDAAGAMLRHFYWRHKFAPRARTYNASNVRVRSWRVSCRVCACVRVCVCVCE
jgi:hypothetical protein